MGKTSKLARWVAITIAVLALIAVCAAYGLSRIVESRITALLGADGSAGSIDVGLKRIRLTDVNLGAPSGWPTPKSLHADEVLIVPDWRSLLSHHTVLQDVHVRGYQLAVWRAGGGRIEILPTLQRHAHERAQADKQASKTPHETEVARIVFENGRLDFYDATVSRTPYRLPMGELLATVGPLHFPHSRVQTNVDITGQVGTEKSPGKAAIKGWIVLDSRDADIKTSLRQVPIGLVQPYLRKGTALAFSGGMLDLDMHTKVESKKLNANGRLTLSDLKLKDEDSVLSIPRRVMLAALEDSKGQASFDFTLTGDINHPKFTTKDNVSVKIAGGLASALGISVQGLAEGIGSTVEGLGSALSGLVPAPLAPAPAPASK